MGAAGGGVSAAGRDPHVAAELGQQVGGDSHLLPSHMTPDGTSRLPCSGTGAKLDAY